MFLVLGSLEKRVLLSRLTNLSVCFDPEVTDVMMTCDETSNLISETFDELSTSIFASFIFSNLGTITNVKPSNFSKAANASMLDLQLTANQHHKRKSDSSSQPEKLLKYLTMHDQRPAREFLACQFSTTSFVGTEGQNLISVSY